MNKEQLNLLVKEIAIQELGQMEEAAAFNNIDTSKFATGVKPVAEVMEKKLAKDANLVEKIEQKLGKKLAKVDFTKGHRDRLVAQAIARDSVSYIVSRCLDKFIAEQKLVDFLSSMGAFSQKKAEEKKLCPKSGKEEKRSPVKESPVRFPSKKVKAKK